MNVDLHRDHKGSVDSSSEQGQLPVPECKTLKISVLSEFMSLHVKSYCSAVSKLGTDLGFTLAGQTARSLLPNLEALT